MAARRAHRVVLCVIAAVTFACGGAGRGEVEGKPATSGDVPGDRAPTTVAERDAPKQVVPVEPSVTPLDPATPLQVTVVDPRVLALLDVPGEQRFVDVLARLHREQRWAPGDVGAGFAAWSSWSTIAATLTSDVDRLIADMAIDWETEIDRTYDRSAAKTPEGADAAHRGNGNVARVFDVRWLSSARAHLPLVAVVYRPDRADFADGGCGELRLLYRLAYLEKTDTPAVRTSRLPMVVNVVLALADDGAGCSNVARSFAGASVVDDASASALAQVLRGPLGATGTRVQQIEINAQLVRFPSDLERVEGRGFAGQAAYGLRIFAPQGDALVPIGLENTPDVLAIAADPEKRARLIESLRMQREGVARGVFRLPDEMLAKVALSWSTHGSARAANRPFSALLEPSDLDALLRDWPGSRTFVHDSTALLERLDTATCMGCHQAASTAGFHVLGVDQPIGDDVAAWAEAVDGNRLALATSPHMLAEQPRRLAYAQALAERRAPDRTRLHPAAPAATWNETIVVGTAAPGMPCPLHADEGTAAWSCAAPMRCRSLITRADGTAVHGMCLPEQPDVHAGMACRAFELTGGARAADGALAFNARAFLDVARETTPPFVMDEGGLTTRTYNCRPAAIGVPLGRVTRRCTNDEWQLATPAGPEGAEVCAIVGGKGFEQMATGAFDAEAFAASTGRGLLDTCSAQRPCREDYICQRLPDFLAGSRHRAAPDRLAALQQAGVGFCTPTYFVYQLRLDGHPKP